MARWRSRHELVEAALPIEERQVPKFSLNAVVYHARSIPAMKLDTTQLNQLTLQMIHKKLTNIYLWIALSYC